MRNIFVYRGTVPVLDNHYLQRILFSLTLSCLIIIALFSATGITFADITFGFTDTEELVLDFDQLAEQQGEFEVELYNHGIAIQEIELCLQASPETSAIVPGEQPPPEEKYYRMTGTLSCSQQLLPNEKKTFVLSIDTSRRMATGNYNLLLVATSSTGEQATRKVLLKVRRPEEVSNASLNLMPEKLDSLTFRGTNFLPSVISPLNDFLWFILVISFFLWVALNLAYILPFVSQKVKHATGHTKEAFKKKFLPKSKLQGEDGTPVPAGREKTELKKIFSPIDICLTIIFCVLIVLLFLSFIDTSLKPAIVRITPLPVSTSGYETVGQVADATSGLGSIIQVGDELKVLGIRHAGQFTGKTSLPGKEDIPTTVLVSDYWLWAFLTIAAGVILGYFITWYYSKKKEPENKKVPEDKGEENIKKQQEIRIKDWQIGAVVGLLAVGSGFATLYYKNAFWGSYLDYLTAFLWGAIGSQGLKYVGGIIEKKLKPSD